MLRANSGRTNEISKRQYVENIELDKECKSVCVLDRVRSGHAFYISCMSQYKPILTSSFFRFSLFYKLTTSSSLWLIWINELRNEFILENVYGLNSMFIREPK